MKLDFSNPEEAPEEFRAVTFNAPPAKKGMRMPSLTALEIQTQGMLLLLLVLFRAYTWLWSHTNAIQTHPRVVLLMATCHWQLCYAGPGNNAADTRATQI